MRKIFHIAAALLLAAASITTGAAPVKNAPPTVSITSPASGSTFTPPATITMTANAADSNGTVAKVEFFSGTTLLVSKTAAPYSHTWTGVAGGTYSLTAKATDNAGAVTTSTPVLVTVAGGQLTVTRPVNGSIETFGSTILGGTFVGDPATTRVWVGNGNLTRLARINPANNSFYAQLPLELGANTFTISVARLDKTSSSATVNVNGLRAPELAILGPAQRTFSGPANVTFAVDAQSPSGSISRVDFINEATGATLKSLAAPPYQYTWPGATHGSYTVAARATDSLGMSSSVSITFSVFTAGAPTVSIISPSNNSAFTGPANVAITAAATTSDGKAATVDFYQNGVFFAATNVAPYSATLSNVAAGSYSLTARATDSFGASTMSAPVPITVTTTASGSDFVQMTSPVNGVSYESPAAINLTARAHQNSLGVTYYRTDTGTNQELGSSTTAPYSFTWNMRTPGTYTVVAEALVRIDGVTEPLPFTSNPITVVVKARAETITYLHNDFLGSPVAATDANGALIWREDYSPYGERMQNNADASANRQFYTGKALDKDTGLSYMNARYYDPHAGRFMAVDPVGFDESNFHSFNRYAYGNNNPYRFVDPDGQSPVDIAFLVFDVAKLGVAVYSGVGVGAALADVGLSVLGVASPIPGVGQALKGLKAADRAVDAVRGAENAAEVAVKKVHGNSHTSTKPAEGYSLRDRDTGAVLKFGETTRGTKRYSSKALQKKNAEIQFEVAGSKKEMHSWQHERILEYKAANNGVRPPLNKSDY